MQDKLLQDTLDLCTKTLAAVTTELRIEQAEVPQSASHLIMVNLCMTSEQSNADPVTLQQQIKKTLDLRDQLLEQVTVKNVLPPEVQWAPAGSADYEEKLKEIEEKTANKQDANGLRQLILSALKGVAQICLAAYDVGYEDDGIALFMERLLLRTLKYNLSVGLLFNLALEVGGNAYRAMNLLDQACQSRYGTARLVNVELGVRNRPGILVCGQNIAALEDVLKATENQGVDVYTHDDLYFAHSYPELQKYDHFAGNYGGARFRQKEDFTSFHGPIIVTSGGIEAPEESYRDRIYTIAPVFYPGIPNLTKSEYGKLVEQAKNSAIPEALQQGEHISGFSCETLQQMSDNLLSSMKDGTLSKLLVLVGDDEPAAAYFTDLCKALPKNAAAITAGSIKFRTMGLQLGTLRGMPRVMDAGGIADLYAVLTVAMKLQEGLGKFDINGVPLAFFVSLHSNLSYAALLAILYVGSKNVYLSKLPEFFTESVFSIFQKNFGLHIITTPEEDAEALFTVPSVKEGSIDVNMLIIDIIEKYPEAAEILMSCGMSCVTCGSALYESLAEACMVHGLDPEDVKEVLDHELGLVEDDE